MARTPLGSTFTGGSLRTLINDIAGSLDALEAMDARAYGAALDGVTDDTAAVQAAIDEGVPLLINSDRVRLGTLVLPSGARLISHRGTEIVSTANVFRPGTLGFKTADALTYYSVGTTMGGATSVACATPAQAGNFAAGDQVYLRGGNFYTSNGYNFYEWSTPNIVVSADAATGVIDLKYPLDEGVTGAFIARVSNAGITSIEAPGQPVFISEGVVVEGFSLTSTGKVFDDCGGSINSRFRFKDATCDSFAYWNAMAHCEISAQTVRFTRHFFELGMAAHSNLVRAQTATMTGPGVVGKNPIRLSENTRGNRVEIGHLDISRYNVSDVPLYLTDGRNNDISIDVCLAQNAPLRVFQFGAQNFTPTPPRGEDNRLRIGKCFAGTATTGTGTGTEGRFGQWFVTGPNTRNVLHNSRFYGAVSKGRAMDVNGTESGLINVWCETGSLYLAGGTPIIADCYFRDDFDPATRSNILKAPGIRGLASDSWRLILGQAKNDQATTVTATTSAASSSQSIPAGALMIGDVLRFEASGFVSGANDAKTVELWIGGSRVVSIPFAAAETGDWMFSGYARVQSLTNLRFAFNIGSDAASAVRLNTGPLTVADLSANALAVELRAWRPNASDTLSLNGFIATAERAGR